LAGTAIENMVDLPEPDGPVTRVRSSLRKLNPSAVTSGVPLGRRTVKPLRLMLPSPPPDVTWIRSALRVSALAAAMPASNPSRRLTTARHSAS
jgi:hypothetical protein